MPTQEIINDCRERDTRGLKIVICTNAETLADGYLETADLDVRGVSAAAHAAAVDDELLGRVEIEGKSFFADWNGGKYARCGEKVAGEPWGYRGGFVCCPAKVVPQWCRDLIDRMNAAMVAELLGQAEAREQELAQLEAEEAAERTAEVIADCRAADKRPS